MRALDLFAGTGWGVACKRLGIVEFGIENMPEAVESRDGAGMDTLLRDVWLGVARPEAIPEHDILIASPPCQTFSRAGEGAGRRNLDTLLSLVSSVPFSPDEARGLFDDRTALVLTPLHYALRHRPRYVVWEQVPEVLPVWEAMGSVLRSIGYSVATGVVNAEQYGVPQTRKRAILMARCDGVEARLPDPTHSRYYSRDPERLDAGVPPWVSMSQALGVPGGEVLRSNYSSGGDLSKRGQRPAGFPASTVTSKAGSMRWVVSGGAFVAPGGGHVADVPEGFSVCGSAGKAVFAGG